MLALIAIIAAFVCLILAATKVETSSPVRLLPLGLALYVGAVLLDRLWPHAG